MLAQSNGLCFFSQDDTDWRGPVIECVWLSLATRPSQGVGLKWERVGCLQMEVYFLLRELMPLWGSCSKGGFVLPLSTVRTSWTICRLKSKENGQRDFIGAPPKLFRTTAESWTIHRLKVTGVSAAALSCSDLEVWEEGGGAHTSAVLVR